MIQVIFSCMTIVQKGSLLMSSTDKREEYNWMWLKLNQQDDYKNNKNEFLEKERS